MIRNTQIDAFFAQLAAANITHRCNWQTKRDPYSKGCDVEHLSFIGEGFSPSVSTAVLVSYGEKDGGYGLYLEATGGTIDGDVARIAKPRKQAEPEPVYDHRDDTVDALTQAESFIEGFEGDDAQEPGTIAELLLIVRAAIKREQAKPDLLASLKELRAWFGAIHQGKKPNLLTRADDVIAAAEA